VLSESRLGTLNLSLLDSSELGQEAFRRTWAEEKVCNIKLVLYSRKAGP